MSDLADNRVIQRVDFHYPVTPQIVAGWLREVREWTLEEAAREMERLNIYNAAAAIRALGKD